jgi:hypothetical protein
LPFLPEADPANSLLVHCSAPWRMAHGHAAWALLHFPSEPITLNMLQVESMQVRQMNNAISAVLNRLDIHRPGGKDVSWHEALDFLLVRIQQSISINPSFTSNWTDLSGPRIYVLSPARDSFSRSWMSVTPPRPQAHLGILGSPKIDLRVLPLFDAVVKADFPRTKISMSRTTLLCGRTRIVMRKMVPCQLRQFSRWDGHLYAK